jgi:type IV pilus biogenesis protein CpaD/CtpE
MLRRLWIALAVAAGAVLSGCAGPEKRAEVPAAAPAEGARITQFYTTQAQVARGETALVCYGVQNAKAVWLEPPRHELSAALARCVDVSPAADTTYKLTAEGEDGQAVTRELKVAVGAARAKIVNVNVSALEVNPGDLVSVCYIVEHARAVTIDPIRFRRASAAKGCATDQPRKSTTYTISAFGAGGDKDQEHVTVKVSDANIK